jgi:hypothetical protein
MAIERCLQNLKRQEMEAHRARMRESAELQERHKLPHSKKGA